MSKLLARLSDPLKSGVYRAGRDHDIRDALKAAGHDVAAVTLGAGKAAMLEAIAKALAFPAWFGGNWDALEDCLSDLSWRKGTGQVILLSRAEAGDDLGILCDILRSVAEDWRGRGRPFFAVFIDPDRKLGLPGLYNEEAPGGAR